MGTDGLPDSNTPTLEEIGQWFHDKHIRVIVAGIGDGVDSDGLRSMTLDHSKTHTMYFPVDHINDIARPQTVDNILEGCNFAYECHATNVKFVTAGDIGKTERYDIGSFGECADECNNHNEKQERIDSSLVQVEPGSLESCTFSKAIWNK